MKNSLSSNAQLQTSSVIRAPLSVIRYQYDNHLGSACLELDHAGKIISYEEYHPFGTTSYRSGHSDTEVSQKRYKYCGKERDEESGLYYYGMRYYVPWLCRFVSVDPLQFEYPYYTPYQYAGNKPVTMVDLDGAEELIPPLQNYSEPLSETNVSFSFTAFNSAGYSFENGSYVEYFNYTFAQMDASLQGENLYYSTEVGTGTVGYQFISPTNSWELVYLDSQYSSTEGMVNVSAETTGSRWGVLDWIQTGLDVLGLIPGAGEIFDLVNAGIYAIRGDYVSAGLSLAATIPIAGSFATGGKLLNKGMKVADAAESVTKTIGRELPTQMHHFATNKSKTFTPRMAEIADEFGLNLNEAWNKQALPHLGRHPNAYHNFVLEGMQNAKAGAGNSQSEFLRLFNQYVKQPVIQNPDLLKKSSW